MDRELSGKTCDEMEQSIENIVMLAIKLANATKACFKTQISLET